MGIRDRSESRDGYAVRVLAVHTSEGHDKPVVDDAAALRDASWWEGSSHAIADNDPGSLLTPAEGCVPYDRASWTLRSGNRWSDNIELIAQAGWTRAQWLARPKLLDNCAQWLAARSKARRIPLVKLTPAQYRAGGSGVIGHHDHTVGYSDGTHWDPGPNFPWDVVLDKARAYAAGTTPQEEDEMQYRFITQDSASPWYAWDGKERFFVDATMKQMLIDCGLAYKDVRVIPPAVMARIPMLTTSGGPSVAEVAAAVVAKLPATSGGATLTAAAVAEAVVDRLAASLTD